MGMDSVLGKKRGEFAICDGIKTGVKQTGCAVGLESAERLF